MTVFKGRKSNPRTVEVKAVSCSGEELDKILRELNSERWGIRQIFQEPPNCYRVVAQRETFVHAN